MVDRTGPPFKRALRQVRALAGRAIAPWYHGNKVLDAKDATFKEAGKVGLWTKADSVIEFDDFTVEPH